MRARALTLVPLALACAPEATTTGLPHDALAPPPAVTVSAVIPGQSLTAVVTGLATGTAVTMRASTGYAPGTCASTLYGACLEVGGPGEPTVQATAVFQRGSAVPTVPVPASLPLGAEVFVQLAGRSPSGTTGTSPAILRVVGCGDGIQTLGETCDDGNVEAGDGCSATCDAEPTTELFTSGVRYGFCFGSCRFDVDHQGARVQYLVSDYQQTSVSVTNPGRLTLRGERRRDQVLAALDTVALRDVYGCPDCFDQGAITFDLTHQGRARAIVVDPTTVPAILIELDALRQDLSTALSTCTASDDVVPGPGCVPQ